MSFAAGVLACGAAVLAVFALASVPAAAAAGAETIRRDFVLWPPIWSYSAPLLMSPGQPRKKHRLRYVPKYGDATVDWLDSGA